MRASPLANSAMASQQLRRPCPPSARRSRAGPSAPVAAGRSGRPCVRACSTNTLHRDKQRPVDLEGGVFRGGADEHDAAFFHKGQKRVLLGLVEAVDLIHKDDGLFAVQRRLCSACCITSRISLMPLVTAEKSMNAALVRLAIIRASVVLPTPGGPQKIMEEMLVALDQPPKHLSRSQQDVAAPQIPPSSGAEAAPPAAAWAAGLVKKFCCSMGSLLRKA